jgi:non-homologous end joining protein Ku
VAGKEVSLTEAPVAKVGGNVIDLMAALKASLDAKTSQVLRGKERLQKERLPPSLAKQQPSK